MSQRLRKERLINFRDSQAVLAGSVEIGYEINRVLGLCEQQLQSAAFCRESFVFARLTNKNLQRFWNGPVHEFYG